MAKFVEDGAVELYHDNSKVFETITAGIKVSRTSASSSYIEMVTSGGVAGYLYGQGNNEIHLMDREGHQFFKGIKDGTVELYHDNVKKFDTNAGGAQCYGNLLLGDSSGLYLGDAYDLRISHDGSTNIIDGLYHPIELRHGSEVHIKCIDDGDVELYHNNIKRLETTTSGISVENTSGDPKLLVTGSGHAELTLTTTSGSDHCSVNFGDSDDHDIGEIRYTNSSNSMSFDVNAATALTINSSQNATFAGTVSDSKGNLRSIPKNAQSSAYTLVAADAGKYVYATGNVTVPDNVFSVGDAITIINENTSTDITIVQGSGVTMYNAADATTGNRTLSGKGVATMIFVLDHERCHISGAGLS